MMKIRRSGILLHITSLPSLYGIGDLGPGAFRFADFLAETKQGLWQILPLHPTDSVYFDSPYSATSAFAGNPLLISPEYMVREGLLSEADVESPPPFPKGQVDYGAVKAYKTKLFHLAHERFRMKTDRDRYEQFCSDNSCWLEDFSLFIVLKVRYHGKSWNKWPPEIRDRRPDTLRMAHKQFYDDVEKEKFLQYIFFQQWFPLKEYCHSKSIQIIGDVPIYVAYDSADVWANPEIFKLDEKKAPSFISGVPPDLCSKTGQLWGNPVYRWDVLKERGYDWWLRRLEHSFKQYDLVRIDHFRGLIAYWEVPASEKTTANGQWVAVPTEDFFRTLFKKLPSPPIIAEDLGTITPDVTQIMRRYDIPGMRPLLFAFGETLPGHNCAPHNISQNSVVYTGTHDLNTVRGWFEKEATPEDRRRLFSYLGRKVSLTQLHRELIRLAMMTVANTVIIPMQDILGLGEEARMNRPGTAYGNWKWRLLPGQITPSIARYLLEVTELYGRA
ncbi:MAG: 4-alpha-glucanotransferase [Syntrophales bacterium]|nr:4-alpha-glucanotransferase [Syntrophales bacterium]